MKKQGSQTASQHPPPPSHFDKIYRYLRNTGATKEDASHGARIASKTLKETVDESVVEPEDKIITKDCPEKSMQIYYNSQKLLQNQQQQTISL